MTVDKFQTRGITITNPRSRHVLGGQLAEFSLMVTEDGETVSYAARAIGRLADIVCKYVQPGQPIYIEGSRRDSTIYVDRLILLAPRVHHAAA